MKKIVIFKSKTGFTEQYAKWVAEDLKCDIAELKNASKIDFKTYDLVIYGGGVYAGKIAGLKKFRGFLGDKSNLNLMIFVTGATPMQGQEIINTTWASNFTEEELRSIPHFYMQSGINYERMGMFSRLMMKAFSKMLSKKDGKTSVEAGVQASITNSHDVSSKEYIKPLVEKVKGLEN